jgi:hypothetical protein
MVSCGAEGQAEEIKQEYPPVCTKLLAKEAKLLVKIMRLYAEDKEKNQKSILLCIFITIKTQLCSKQFTKPKYKRNVPLWQNNISLPFKIKEIVLKALIDFHSLLKNSMVIF